MKAREPCVVVPPQSLDVRRRLDDGLSRFRRRRGAVVLDGHQLAVIVEGRQFVFARTEVELRSLTARELLHRPALPARRAQFRGGARRRGALRLRLAHGLAQRRLAPSQRRVVFVHERAR